MYRPQSVRNFKIFVGELTATVAAVHVSLYEFREIEHTAGKSFWSDTSAKHGIVLSGMKINKILLSQSRLSIVSLYSGFDVFSAKLKEEKESIGETWIKKNKESLLDTVLSNSVGNVSSSFTKGHIIVCFDYYRLLRNSVVHPTEKNKSNVIDYYNKNTDHLDSVRRRYAMQSAPNSPSEISFHDVKLLCRLLLDMTSTIGEAYDPGNEALAKIVPTKNFKKYGANKDRVNNAIVGYLKTEYGLTNDRATEISELISAH